MKKRGIILINVGTPDAPRAKEVRSYLKTFLMDPRILDIPWILRLLLVHFMIIPGRAETSAALYRKIWTERGSPLLANSEDLRQKLSSFLEERFPGENLVALGMRYGNPSIKAAIGELIHRGAEEIVAVPLFPQFAEATTGSAMAEVVNVLGNRVPLLWTPEFFAHPAFAEAHAALAETQIQKLKPDYFLFTYHGLPERQIAKQTSGNKCLPGGTGSANFDCCETRAACERCYRAQCFHTTRLLATRLGLPPGRFSTSFQSRLGRTPWIRPYTDEILQSLPRRGYPKLMLLTPAFVSDCLETLEEISVQGRDLFLQNGGKEFYAMPCLNAEDPWVASLSQIIRESKPMTKP